MRVVRVEMVSYGKFSGQKMDFQEANQLIFGENEAGKSTVFSFIETMLFGFEKATKNRRNFSRKDALRTGGRLVFEKHGVVYTLERYKESNKGEVSFTSSTGETGGEVELKQVLFPLNRELFRQIYCFSQEGLRLGQNVDEESLNRQLVSLGLSGSQKLLDIEKEAARIAEELYKPMGVHPTINRLLNEMDEINKKIATKKVEQESFLRVKGKLAEQTSFVKEKQTELEVLEKKIEENHFFISDKKAEAKHIAMNKKEGDVDVLGFKAFQELIQTKSEEKGVLVGKRALIDEELSKLERMHPALIHPKRRVQKSASKVGVLTLFLSILLSIVATFVLTGWVRITLIVAFLLIGAVNFILVGLTNQRQSFHLTKLKWDDFLFKLEEVENELAMIEEEISKLRFEEKKYLSQKKNVTELEISASMELNEKQLSEIQRENQNFFDRKEIVTQEIDDARYVIQEMMFQKSRLEQDGTLDECLQEKTMKEEQLLQAIHQYGVQNSKRQFVQNLLKELSVVQLPDLLIEASKIFSQLTLQRFRSIRYEDGILVENQEGDRFELINLSTGARDQLILSLRFAFLMIQQRPISPLIIDDGWLNYDKTRKTAFYEFVTQLSEHHQVILFSSDEQMKELYVENEKEVQIIGGLS